MTETFSTLVVATVVVAVVHSLAPDHWLPFVMIGKAQTWSRVRLSWVTILAGIAHVGSSILIGGIGILLGIAAISLQGIEATRTTLGILLLIGFGLVYALWGLKHSKKHHHHHSFDLSGKKAVTLWTLFAVFVLGPCEPLIPLMFLATSRGLFGIVVISTIFACTTILMMVGQTLLGFSGMELIRHEFAEKYSHAMAGVAVVMTGVFLLFV